MALARSILIAVQALSFVGLAGILYATGEWKLASAQALLAGVTVLVYTT